MPTIITASQLRQVLGVSSALYDDAYLNGIIDTSEEVIIPMLAKYSAYVARYKRVGTLATLTTKEPHEFLVGQQIVVDYIPTANFNGNHTITAVTEDTIQFTTQQSSTIDEQPLVPLGIVYLQNQKYWESEPAIKSAVIVVSTEVFQARTAAGGQIEGVDFTPSPFRMGRSLYNRVAALLAPYVDVETIAL